MPSAEPLQPLKGKSNHIGFSEIPEQISIELDSQNTVWSAAFLGNGRIVGGGDDGKIRCWRVTDGHEVGMPMDAGSPVHSIAVSQDGKWIVSGTESCQVTLWDAESHEKVTEFKGHNSWVSALDVSPDATRIATGSYDLTASVWSLPTGQRLLDFGHSWLTVLTVKFSPSGLLFAASSASLFRSDSHSLCVYATESGDLLVDIPSIRAISIAWTSDSKRLFTLSHDGNIHCLDVESSGKTLSKWPIHGHDEPRCICLSGDGAVLAACANSSISFWHASTHEKIGLIIRHPASVESMAMSPNYDLAASGGAKVILWNLDKIFSTDNHNYVQSNGAEVPLSGTVQPSHKQDKHSSDERPENFEGVGQDPQETAGVPNDGLNEGIGPLHAEPHTLEMTSNDRITKLENIIEELRVQLVNSQQKTDSLANILFVYRQRYQCEALYTDGNVIDAAKFLFEITMFISDDVKADTPIMDWLSGFTIKCITSLERTGDKALKSGKDTEALAAYATALSLGPSNSNALLAKWARTMLPHESMNVILDGAKGFRLPRFTVYSSICDVLEADGRITEAVMCFQQMQSELMVDTGAPDEQKQWEIDFQQLCAKKLEGLAGAAMNRENYNEAVEHYSTLLSLNSVDHVDILIKRSKARVMMKSWEKALEDTEEAIRLDPSSHRGYDQRHATLLAAGPPDATEAFDDLASLLGGSFDEGDNELHSQYADPRTTIRQIIDAIISRMPRVLIDTSTGQLHDRTQQAEAFEALPMFSRLVASTKETGYALVLREVKRFYRYVMLSHRWERDEPLLEEVERMTVYKLGASRANIKLQTFCLLARSLGFRWAWSDTCCIEKGNHAILQESLVAMFTWYRGSSLTIIYLLGVSSLSYGPDCLRWSVWNSRVWTYQEYVAATRVQFYTEDWKPYLGLTLSNHKDSPIILGEMEVPQVSTEQLAVLQPGLSSVRQKLYLASTRHTTLVEDIAYSLLGIFNAAIPVIYGEGTRAIGRLLEFVLMGSGDATILAWTGTSNNYNSCLPISLAVYDRLMPPHIPHMETIELDQMVARIRASLTDLNLATMLFDQLNQLPTPTIASSRLQLPGIASGLSNVVRTSRPSSRTRLCTYRAMTALFGNIEIRTKSDLTTMGHLFLVHPWIRPLLDQEYSRDGSDDTTQALRMVARLRQPFGALLFEQLSRVEYQRVATDALIMVQIRDDTPLSALIRSIRTMDVQ